jgi:acetyl esterase
VVDSWDMAAQYTAQFCYRPVMPIDDEARALLELIAAARRPAFNALSAADARVSYKQSRKALHPDPPDVASVDDRSVPGPHGPVPLRIYRPLGSHAADLLPVLVYFHGGGFMIGDLDTHDVVCRSLANAAWCAIVAVDYRLAPEHQFPRAVDDCFAATKWVADNSASLNLDPARLAVGGDSAGANLAAVVAILARDAGAPAIAFQLLLYPTTDMHHDMASAQELADGYLLTLPVMHYFRANYLRSEADRDDWRASPLLAKDLSRLPPALIVTAGFDPLKDEGKAYAERLNAAGVPATYICYEGTIHGFVTMGRALKVADLAIAKAAAALSAAFAVEPVKG